MAAAAARVKSPAATADLVGQIGIDFKNVFSTQENLWIITAGLGAAWGASYFDEQIASSNFNSEKHEGNSFDPYFEGGEKLGGGLVQVGGAFATYGLGKILSKPAIQDLGRDLVRAQVVNVTLTFGLKLAVGRERPDSSDSRSFPSGHASCSFATATVLQRHYGWRAGVPAYLVASYIAASRMNENKHYLSDIVFGAALGIVAGRTVTLNVARNGFMVNPLLAPDGWGIKLMWPGPRRRGVRI